MSEPKVIFSIQEHNDRYLLLEIIAPEGSWSIPMEKQQAEILADELKAKIETMPPKQKLLKEFLDESMIRLPSGQLWMGSMPAEDIPEDECPRHKVLIQRPFFLCSVLVTQGLYLDIMGENPSEEKGAKKAVSHCNWHEALAFCNALSERMGLQPVYHLVNGEMSWNQDANGYRLPTEVEWEFAVRTKDDLRYSGSDHLDEVAFCQENSSEMPDIAQKKANIWGFYDMSGTVFEWCWDAFAPYSTPEDSSAEKVCRGGSWKHPAQYARSTARYSALAQHRGMIGIRLARNAD